MSVNKVSIIGLGLMGGSLGLALKSRGFQGVVAGYARRSATAQKALAMGAVDDVYDTPERAVHDADLVVYCTPILTIPDLVKASIPHLKENAILTDVGSTKAVLDCQINELLKGHTFRFIGSHPVAGSQLQGIEAARKDLYENAMVVVTPPHEMQDSDNKLVEELSSFWGLLGSVVVVMSPDKHDAVLARTSHMPHLLASLLAIAAGRDNDPSLIGPFCGTGFRDTTRIADGSPDVWHDIVKTNAAAIVEELESYRDVLNHLIKRLNEGDYEEVKNLLAQGRDLRRMLMKHSPVE